MCCRLASTTAAPIGPFPGAACGGGDRTRQALAAFTGGGWIHVAYARDHGWLSRGCRNHRVQARATGGSNAHLASLDAVIGDVALCICGRYCDRLRISRGKFDQLVARWILDHSDIIGPQDQGLAAL